jgi:hypothetical protein
VQQQCSWQLRQQQAGHLLQHTRTRNQHQQTYVQALCGSAGCCNDGIALGAGCDGSLLLCGTNDGFVVLNAAGRVARDSTHFSIFQHDLGTPCSKLINDDASHVVLCLRLTRLSPPLRVLNMAQPKCMKHNCKQCKQLLMEHTVWHTLGCLALVVDLIGCCLCHLQMALFYAAKT